MQNASQALAGALPTANAVNPSLLVNLQESLKLGSLPSLAGSYLDLFRRSSAGETSWLSKPVVGSLLALVATLLVIEQVVYRNKKAHLPGARWTIPVIGKFADSMNPRLENYKKQWASGALSAVSVFNIFIVIASSNEYSRKILNSPNYAEPCLVASAKPILLKENWVFLHGKVHADYRKALNVLFTKKALSIYLPIQERIYRKYFKSWMNDSDPKAKPYMMAMRDLNMETSLRVFLGNYISDEGAQEISDKYWLITLALQLVNFPLALPGTNVWNAIKARKIAMKHLTAAAGASKKRMAEGGEPNCLLDAWISEMISARAGDGDEEQKRVLSREYSDHEIAMVVLSFLFASQDAMTSAIVYLFQLMADHPEILAKVREEQYRIRGADIEGPTTLDMVDDMVYTRACIKESLRLMPPVIMVPYLAKKAFKISEDYTAPAGTMVIPSFWNSLHDETVYPKPDEFIPERWMPLPEGGVPLAEQSPQNYMVWGSGPHKCIGVQYASMHLAAVIGSASVLMDWEHDKTPDSDEAQVLCTLFPKDGLRLKFRPRAPPS
ncbi:RNA polymerase C-22 sterol desaturase [Naganishia albida]|nr:RNA polymerase C-22 sterol desaturase [Naganishia albida]